jgi:hypothetical protein
LPLAAVRAIGDQHDVAARIVIVRQVLQPDAAVGAPALGATEKLPPPQHTPTRFDVGEGVFGNACPTELIATHSNLAASPRLPLREGTGMRAKSAILQLP